MSSLLISVLVLHVIFNFYVSYKIIRSDYFNSFQKKVQIISIWLVPFLTSIGIWMFLISEDRESSNIRRGAKDKNEVVDFCE